MEDSKSREETLDQKNWDQQQETKTDHRDRSQITSRQFIYYDGLNGLNLVISRPDCYLS